VTIKLQSLSTNNAQAQIDGDRAQEARGPRTDQGCPFADRSYRRKKDAFWLLFGVYQKVARWPQDSGSF
jgi:hypothetical protein